MSKEDLIVHNGSVLVGTDGRDLTESVQAPTLEHYAKLGEVNTTVDRVLHWGAAGGWTRQVVEIINQAVSIAADVSDREPRLPRFNTSADKERLRHNLLMVRYRVLRVDPAFKLNMVPALARMLENDWDDWDEDRLTKFLEREEGDLIMGLLPQSVMTQGVDSDKQLLALAETGIEDMGYLPAAFGLYAKKDDGLDDLGAAFNRYHFSLLYLHSVVRNHPRLLECLGVDLARGPNVKTSCVFHGDQMSELQGQVLASLNDGASEAPVGSIEV